MQLCNSKMLKAQLEGFVPEVQSLQDFDPMPLTLDCKYNALRTEQSERVCESVHVHQASHITILYLIQ